MLQIYAFRDGRLAQFGHNHVISSKILLGYVRLAKSTQESSFVFCLPVATLVVDNPELRAAAGAQFDSRPSETAIAGTRSNMLGDKLLNKQLYPYLIIEGRGLAKSADTISVQLTITVKGREYLRNSTTKIKLDRRGIQASGMMKIRQTDLGLKPFSVLFGTLKVRDELQIKYFIQTR